MDARKNRRSSQGRTSKKKAAKPPSIRKLFVERMRREGREAEWRAVLRSVMEETGRRFAQASGEAMRRMGYEGPQRERELYAKHLAAEGRSKLRRQIDREREAIIRDREDVALERAMKGLPASVNLDTELTWVATHPAVARKERGANDRQLRLTAEDVMGSRHERAPSMRAVWLLQHGMRNPGEFWRMYFVRQQKDRPVERQREPETAESMTLAEVKDCLSQLQNRVPDSEQ
ncbi:MAG TPA: hypothetical protein VJL29_01835 [Thermoguttaceae bacterium]|nr:hypothetical protein [Thermoguttaceae bacterium]